MLASLVLGLLLPRWEIMHGSPIPNNLSTSSTQAFLGAVSSGMITLAAIVFSIAFVVAQFSATAYTPRLTVELSKDTLQFHALGLFIATFTFSLCTLLWIDRGGSQLVPSSSELIVGLLVAASMIVLALMVQNFQQFNIAYVLRLIGARGRRALAHDARTRPGTILPPTPDTVGALEATATAYYSGEPMTIADYDLSALLAQARASNAIIVMHNAVGATLAQGSLLYTVRRGTVAVSDALRRHVKLAHARTFADDPEFAIRLFVDIAIRALSPAINDPTTAVQALDQIEDYLIRIGTAPIPTGYLGDAAGELRVVYPTPAWSDFLNLAFNEIRFYGSNSIQVQRRLRAALENLAGIIADPARHEVVLAYRRRLDAASDGSLDAADRELARRADRQGIGGTTTA